MTENYLNQCSWWWNIANWTLKSKLQCNFNWNSNIFIEENIFKNIVCETVAILSRERWVDNLHAEFPLLVSYETNFSEILIKIQNFSFQEMYLKLFSAKWQPFCSSLFESCHYMTITWYRLKIDTSQKHINLAKWNSQHYVWGGGEGPRMHSIVTKTRKFWVTN